MFEMVDGGHTTAISSYVTLVEVLVNPIKNGHWQLVQQYREILLGSRHFQLKPVDQHVAEKGAEIRARYGFRTPDALQIATALTNGADAFVTNDHRLAGCAEVEVLLLDQFLPPPAPG